MGGQVAYCTVDCRIPFLVVGFAVMSLSELIDSSVTKENSKTQQT